MSDECWRCPVCERYHPVTLTLFEVPVRVCDRITGDNWILLTDQPLEARDMALGQPVTGHAVIVSSPSVALQAEPC